MRHAETGPAIPKAGLVHAVAKPVHRRDAEYEQTMRLCAYSNNDAKPQRLRTTKMNMMMLVVQHHCACNRFAPMKQRRGKRKASASVPTGVGVVGDYTVAPGAVQQRGLTPTGHDQQVVLWQEDRADEAPCVHVLGLRASGEAASCLPTRPS